MSNIVWHSWRSGVRMVDRTRWKLDGEELHRDDFDGTRKTYLAPPYARTPRALVAWANRVILAEARRELRYARRIAHALGGE